MRNVARHFVGATLALAVVSGAATSVLGAPKKSAASPSPGASADASASPAPLPTASPEPPDVAIPRLEAKIKASPDDKDSLQQLAGYYLSVGKSEQTLTLTQRLLSLGAKSAQVYYLDGVANQSLGRIKEATSDFEQATNQEPTNAQILLTLTDLYLRTNRAPDAERVAKRATTFNPTDKRVFENYGLVLGQEGKFDEARTQFEAASKLDPKDPAPVVLAARSYTSQKALALAGQEFDRALTIDPKYPDALLGKASLQAVNHDVKNAVATYESLLAVEPTDDTKAAVLIQEYQLYRDEKMNDQALQILKRAAQDYGKIPAVHIAYGDYDADVAKDRPAAENEWKTALGPNRDNPDALGRLGALSASQNRKADAIGYFKRLTEVASNDPSSWSVLAQVYAQNGQFQSARDAYRHSFELARTPQALAGLGEVDFQLHNYKECSQIFTAIDHGAGAFMRQNPQLYFLYGRCAQSGGDRNLARGVYTRLKAMFKPGSPAVAQIDKAIQSLGPTGAKAPAKTSTKAGAKPHASPSPSASAKPSH